MPHNAWIFDPATLTVEPIEFRRDVGAIDIALKGPAYLESTDPREYNFACRLLDAESTIKVSPYTVHETKNHVYKAWVRDRQADPSSETGVRFFKSSARFYGKAALVKYKRVGEKPRIRYEELIERIVERELFYEPAEIVPYARPNGKYEWTNDPAPQVNGFVFDGSSDTYEVRDLMYTCAFCEKCCEGLRCGRCGKAFYCDSSCQKQHWASHKKDCKKSSVDSA